jgi:NCS1 family nucleobase:cation symporter-1
VISRLSWGVFGANVPAIIRALAAIAWYGIQTYLAAAAVKAILARFLPRPGGRVEPRLVPRLGRAELGVVPSSWPAGPD